MQHWNEATNGLEALLLRSIVFPYFLSQILGPICIFLPRDLLHEYLSIFYLISMALFTVFGMMAVHVAFLMDPSFTCSFNNL